MLPIYLYIYNANRVKVLWLIRIYLTFVQFSLFVNLIILLVLSYWLHINTSASFSTFNLQIRIQLPNLSLLIFALQLPYTIVPMATINVTIHLLVTNLFSCIVRLCSCIFWGHFSGVCDVLCWNFIFWRQYIFLVHKIWQSYVVTRGCTYIAKWEGPYRCG